MSDADPILVLPREACPSSEAQTFGVAFPGVWYPGEPRPVSELGLTAEQARRLLGQGSLPLVEVKQTPERPAARERAKKPEADE